MKVGKFLAGFLMCLIGAFFICGCSLNDGFNSSKKFDEKNKMKVFLITMDKELPYWKGIDKGCRKAVAETGIIDYGWIGPFERDELMQSECIDKAVKDKVDVILISAVPGELVKDSLEKAKKSGVKIIFVDNRTDCEDVVTLMTDNENAGKIAGETMLQALRSKGLQSGIIGVVSNSSGIINTELRDKGFRKVFEGSSFELAPTIYADGNPNVVIDSVKEHSDYVGFFGANQSSTLLIGEQIKNFSGNQVVIGFDTADKTVDLVKEGVIYATMKQNTEKMGYDGIKIAVEIMNEKYDNDVKNIDTGITVITKDNLLRVED